MREQRSFKSAFVVDEDKKEAAKKVLSSLGPKHRERLTQVKQMIEMYIKLAELDTRREVRGQWAMVLHPCLSLFQP